MPIARELIADDQLPLLDFDAFFENTMFHEVAHGLGIKNTINGKGPVRTALKEHASALEEGKADILGLYMVQSLDAQGELPGQDMRSNYVSFLASLVRSIRFGAGSAHGRANIAAFNVLQEAGAFTRDGRTGKYRVDVPTFQAAMNALTGKILTLQGNGDYEGGRCLPAAVRQHLPAAAAGPRPPEDEGDPGRPGLRAGPLSRGGLNPSGIGAV